MFLLKPLIALFRLWNVSSRLPKIFSFKIPANPLSSFPFPNIYSWNFSEVVKYPTVAPTMRLGIVPNGPTNNPAIIPADIFGNAFLILACRALDINPSLLSSPNIHFLALSEDFTNPAAPPKIAPITGDPINSPAAPPRAAPFAISGTFLFMKLATFLDNRPPLTSPVFSSITFPNKIFCTVLEFTTNPAPAPIAAPNNGPTTAPDNTETPAPIIAPAPIAPLLSPASLKILLIALLIVLLSS